MTKLVSDHISSRTIWAWEHKIGIGIFSRHRKTEGGVKKMLAFLWRENIMGLISGATESEWGMSVTKKTIMWNLTKNLSVNRGSC